MITRQTIITKTCDAADCEQSLRITDTDPLTESIAIQLGMWLTVSSEIVTPEGVQVTAKQFCSTTCLREYITAQVTEYLDAESRVLEPKRIVLTDAPDV